MIDIKDTEERNNALKTFLLGGSFIMCLWVFLPFLIRTRLDPLLAAFQPRPLRWLGAVVSAAGYLLAVWCVMLFIKEGKGTPLPFFPPKRLVGGGPYRFVRNPMVLGTVLFLAGSGLALGSCGILLYASLLFLVMHLFVLIEEKALAKRFGSAYAAYREKTPRWWPRLHNPQD